ncbi:hypothetical protein Cgig2_025132 [Carnegiea gigantea]|uniref:PSP proline-rich domain-containing protein n=1 Tax=Carnegiea gigantea TaxID=171969 RepID=A0A9Q1KRH3_9CARY|nr:hypothetical protein Cgig2_025132 [Carnegiea gigantea]
MNFHVSSNTNNVSGNSVESDSSNINNNAAEDGSQNSCDDVIFTMEDLEKKEEEKKCAHTMIANVDKDPIVSSSVQSVELAESLSVSHVTVIDQREQHGINETSGKFVVEFDLSDSLIMLCLSLVLIPNSLFEFANFDSWSKMPSRMHYQRIIGPCTVHFFTKVNINLTSSFAVAVKESSRSSFTSGLSGMPRTVLQLRILLNLWNLVKKLFFLHCMLVQISLPQWGGLLGVAAPSTKKLWGLNSARGMGEFVHLSLPLPCLLQSFSMDVHVRKKQCKRPFSTDIGCPPLYDRGYAVGLASDEGVTEERAVDLREAPRCFNCGSYNHSLNECSKPRDNSAVNSARKQYLNKKNQNAGPRVPTRYYQESPGGKFDGLKPGGLSSETRKLLGIGELDPPPWLNRMRELGYPPGYLQAEDQPSGIAIYADEDTDNATVENDHSLNPQKSPKKMTVDFPGINVPMPENADPWLWTAPTPRGPPHPDLSWNQLNRQSHAQHSMRPNHHTPSSHLNFGSSPPLPHYRHHYYPSEPLSSRGIPIPAPASPSYGRPSIPGMPLLHYNYSSF